ncbi:ADP-ribosylation factor-like protein 6-interacting protein 4 isoform X2 [Leptidea sinapis]|nr:ADP-ribosylation factor-like protein 6-interacting protein 4 isoform X2 [Leptidea sinapis]
MEKSKAMAPMTKEEWEKKQSVIRRVLDEETGRHRLIKGDGEVLEEIVSYDRHKQINQQATRADGDFFQMKTINK